MSNDEITSGSKSFDGYQIVDEDFCKRSEFVIRRDGPGKIFEIILDKDTCYFIRVDYKVITKHGTNTATDGGAHIAIFRAGQTFYIQKKHCNRNYTEPEISDNILSIHYNYPDCISIKCKIIVEEY